MNTEDLDLFYYLNEDKTVTQCNAEKWAEQFNDLRVIGEHHVALEFVNHFEISTVFLGNNHNLGGGKPHIFETMVFKEIGDEIYCDRYFTWDEAVEGHKKAIAWVKDGCKN